MESKDLLKFHQGLTKVGIVFFVGFSFFYYAHISTLEQQVVNLNQEIEIDNVNIDAASSNNTKIALIKTNLAKVKSLKRLNNMLLIYRIVAILFILLGLAAMVYGMLNIKNHYFPPVKKEEKAESV